MSHSSAPLCVRLDGAVVRTSVIAESLLLLVKRNVLYLFAALFWVCRGRANLKAEIAKRVEIDPASLPYHRDLLDWLARERASGRRIWLCTSLHRKPAGRIAEHLQLFDGVIASDDLSHLGARDQARRLVEEFGYRAFDYCGCAREDGESWRCAHGAVLVSGDRHIASEIAAVTPVLHTFPRSGTRWRALLRALRPHQWAKNVLVFVPLLAAHRAGHIDALTAAGLGFVAFCLCASSVYVLNDLLDLDADRAHVRKSRRPFAAGDLPIATGMWLAALLLIGAGLVASLLPLEFQISLAAYYALTLAYSFRLKGMLLVDATALAGLYTLRIIAGAFAISTAPSFWLLLFSIFLFLSLAFVKRYAELDALRRSSQLAATGRSYHVQDLPLLECLGIASGYISVLVLALYINSPAVVPLYGQPHFIWILCVLLLYWISRVWMRAHRGAMNEDPVLFALRDRASLALGLVGAVTLGLAI